MNYLQLCQRLYLEVGASGSVTAVAGATGESLRAVTWINQAWEDIQRERPDWRWMRKSTSFATVAEQAEYEYDATPLSLTDFANWKRGTFRIYKDSIDNELILSEYDYDNFRDSYLISTLRTSYSQPTAITISPTNSLILALPPVDTSYTVTGDYHATATALGADGDTPEMPERFHIAIVYKAMMMYGGYESAVEVYQRGEIEYRKIMARLEIDQLPPLVVRRDF